MVYRNSLPVRSCFALESGQTNHPFFILEQTAGKLGDLQIATVSPGSYREVLFWIHQQQGEQTQEVRFNEAVLRANKAKRSMPALEVRSQNRRVAAAYFIQLPGNVSTLGGIRDESERRPEASQLLLNALTDHLRAASVRQIQAVVSATDHATTQIISASKFEILTRVTHLAVELANAVLRDTPIESTAPIEHRLLHWGDARKLGKTELANLIANTFEDTLDCPSLNGLRSREETLDGFLDGLQLEQVEHWSVLFDSDKAAGCVLLAPHPGKLMELAYFGLTKQYRGRNLGLQLVARAIRVAQNARANILAAAVDEQNWPALALYERFQFVRHKQHDIWLLPDSV